jgi:hypothetical protein
MKREQPDRYAELDLSDTTAIDAEVNKVLDQLRPANAQQNEESESDVETAGRVTLNNWMGTDRPSTGDSIKAERPKRSKKAGLAQKLSSL